jgi:hypothetical protein
MQGKLSGKLLYFKSYAFPERSSGFLQRNLITWGVRLIPRFLEVRLWYIV